jgi:DNA-binding CsgD family transcriptional regulator
MVQKLSDLKEGDIILNIMHRRVFHENKNLILIDVGPTGSGKSYRGLRRIELWYTRILKKPLPIENICFSLEEVMDRLNSGELKKGDIIELEEGGVNQGNLDFQNKMSKIFNYVLQSFRSLNIILMINLPYFGMLNKQTRMLAHYMEESIGIDKTKKQSIAKPFMLQVNQETGKIYKHYPRIIVDGTYEQINNIRYNLPSQEAQELYEVKKEAFVRQLISKGLDTMKMKDKKALTQRQMQIYSYWMQGITNQREIAEKLGCTHQNISQECMGMRKKGYLQEESIGFKQSTPPRNLSGLGISDTSTTQKQGFPQEIRVKDWEELPDV